VKRSELPDSTSKGANPEGVAETALESGVDQMNSDESA
jgi:hypothetical protein